MLSAKSTRSLVLFGLALGLLGAAGVARADDTSSGCGVGWQVTKKMSLLATTTRGTTNFFLPNTFSMTSGTSGCAKHPIAKRDETGVVFVASNYVPLQIQMAEGRGEYLDGLARSMGCGPAADAEFGRMTQKNFREITRDGKSDAFDVYMSVKQRVQSTPALASLCAA